MATTKSDTRSWPPHRGGEEFLSKKANTQSGFAHGDYGAGGGGGYGGSGGGYGGVGGRYGGGSGGYGGGGGRVGGTNAADGCGS
ncbi:unnamed protein product [Chondrus crispus]|uniref:Uncharacterized protein n=1 Tax=Chondrus crispus TaxID=2769 RepID=R7QAX0_CHOCR|nr:unnamed protein product [Chondrus crispus]CDF34546.1 unnamed protein product [Chondrus crispus]|eukprot:XP_005714365.1 unnamed protein product [Chondrus crispus]